MSQNEGLTPTNCGQGIIHTWMMQPYKDQGNYASKAICQSDNSVLHSRVIDGIDEAVFI